MVIITAGTFGKRKGKQVIPITEKDGPVSLGAALEAELVQKGVARYANNAAETEEKHISEELPAYSEDMKLSELKGIAKAYGIDADKATKKSEIIAAIEESRKEENLDDEDAEDDELPKLDAEEIS